MPTAVHFRNFNADDLPELEQMVLVLYRKDAAAEAMSPRKIYRTVDELARHPEKGKIILFQAGEAVAGYAMLVYFWSNEYGGNIAIIDELYVKPAWRGQGIGSAFFSHLLAEEGDTLQGLLLEVTPANDRAYAFYTRLGFAPAKNRYLFRLGGSRDIGI